jgi:predicted histidine transporter YuiF (NhaC family)
MFNPFVDDLSNLSDDEVNTKITELTRRYWQTKNSQLQGQIVTILEMYKQEQQTRQARQRQESQNPDDPDLDNLININ